MNRPALIVGHLSPDLDCLTAIWMLLRFGNMADAELHFVPAGETLDHRPPDATPHIVHVDTGNGRYDHHHRGAQNLSSAELVRRAIRPYDRALERMVKQVTLIDNAQASGDGGFFNISALITGYNLLFPTKPHHVAYAMLPNLDAWYEHELRQIRLEQAFGEHLTFSTPWGKGIAMESADGGSSKLAYAQGAILYAYRDGNGWMGIAAQSRSSVDLSDVYADLQERDPGADWYLHPNKRLLLCGTPKSPPRTPSRLSLAELVEIIQRVPQRI